MSYYSSYYCFPSSCCSNPSYPNYCPPISCNNICPPIIPPPTIPIQTLTPTYIISAVTATNIPSGGVPIPANSIIIPPNTVTIIGGFTGVPSTSIGNCVTFSALNSQFTVNSAGTYLISGSIAFLPQALPITPPSTNIRAFYIYKIDGVSGIISLVAADSREVYNGISLIQITLTTHVYLNANDKIFFASTQNSGVTIATSVTSDINNRYTITKL